MIPLRIKGANAVMGGEGLPSLSVKVNKNIFYSSWEPTPEEVTLIQNGGRVIIACMGIQPYIMISAVETDLEYRDYVSPYKPKVELGELDWAHVEAKKTAKKRGRPRKSVSNETDSTE